MQLKVVFLVDVPDTVSVDDAEDWIKFELGFHGSLLQANPLCDNDIKATRVDVEIY